MEESHVKWKGRSVGAALVDFGLYFFHYTQYYTQCNATSHIARTCPAFYLPKLENYHEARLWNDIFVFSQDYLQIPQGTIKATVLIEHILAVFQMEEILYELRHHSAGLNCGRWDYIFSYLKKFAHFSEFVLPDRKNVTMTVPMMERYVRLLVATCHRRGAYAIGGMAAQIPVKNDEELNQTNMEKVYLDKKREAELGMDGTWIAHPGMLRTARDAFNQFRKVDGDHQLSYQPRMEDILASELIEVPKGHITWKGVCDNLHVSLLYMTHWLRGNGAVAINHLMEDAATAEISRMQLWQWIHHEVNTEEGNPITHATVMEQVDSSAYDPRALQVLRNMLEREVPDEFMTNLLYPFLS